MAAPITRRHLIQTLGLSAMATVTLPSSVRANTNQQHQLQPGEPATVHLKKGTGVSVAFGGTQMQFKLNTQQTSGHMACDESTLQPGFMGAPPHLHKALDEICYVLEGTVHILVGETVYEVNAGDWHLRPRGIIHTFWNSGTVPARYIDIYTPGGHEKYLADLASLFVNGNRPKKEDFSRLEKDHDIVYRFDLLPGIMQQYSVHL